MSSQVLVSQIFFLSFGGIVPSQGDPVLGPRQTLHLWLRVSSFFWHLVQYFGATPLHVFLCNLHVAIRPYFSWSEPKSLDLSMICPNLDRLANCFKGPHSTIKRAHHWRRKNRNMAGFAAQPLFFCAWNRLAIFHASTWQPETEIWVSDVSHDVCFNMATPDDLIPPFCKGHSSWPN